MSTPDRNTKAVAPMCHRPDCGVRHWASQPHLNETAPGEAYVSHDQPKRSTSEPDPKAHLSQIEGCVCLKPKCGHKWVPRNILKRPKYCPKCKTRTWDREPVIT